MDFEAAKDVRKNVKHDLATDAISEKHKFLIENIASEKEAYNDFAEGRPIK